MSNNNRRSGGNRSNGMGMPLLVAAAGVVLSAAALEHVQAHQERRDSIADNVGRWIRDNIINGVAEPGGSTRSRSLSGSSRDGRPLTRTEIESLPVRCLPGNDTRTISGTSGVTAAENDDEKAFCVVCRDHYQQGDNLMRLPCFHEFHSECIRDYLEETEDPACPICRHPVRGTSYGG